MYHAKAQGRNTYRYFNEEMDKEISEKATLRNMLHGVLERNELEVQYQPQVNTQDGSVTGIEALLRWNSPEAGNVSPEKFIPLLEEIGLISKVGLWVLRQACTHAMVLRDKGLGNFRMSVNVSPHQFLFEQFVTDVENVLQETGLEAKFLEIEITENIFMEDLELVNQALSLLKDLGISITLDDFGTGYSSLGYLKRFPINGVKIDKVFIQDITRNDDSRELVTAIVAMTKGLNMKTLVAEGVETDAQLQILRKAGCPSYQGYLYSRPVRFAVLERQLFSGPRLKSI
jgi:EAL domain-containing protein (putative c-di-GMP-specific phosphodiesterase class I)